MKKLESFDTIDVYTMKEPAKIDNGLFTMYLAPNQNWDKKSQAELEKENKVFVIRPTIPEISRTEDDYNKKITYYNHGYSQMRTGFNDLQEYLNS